ncbi:hypothetical protein NMY27_00575 [Cronobacter dublinensis subsp. beijingensis]|uniref:hypothetical protein n=1 Tax=Cronobacter dublinensis TaxID=413497 RepID=UPI0023D9E6C3|nr:hypothetical protein [Cronobacter dublinensis]WEP49780.1 hypothetical protein NMY27_00575 [Cronobacter dublinensis]
MNKFMVTTSDVKKIISSDAYMHLLSQTVSLSNVIINKSDPPGQVLNLEAGRINHSGIEIIDLESTILSDSADIARFSVIKLTGLTDDDIDDYNEDGDEDLVIENLPFYKSFLIGYVLEYYLLKNNPAKLEAYLKKIRMPNYKDYTSELKDFYSEL